MAVISKSFSSKVAVISKSQRNFRNHLELVKTNGSKSNKNANRNQFRNNIPDNILKETQEAKETILQ